LRPPLEDEIIKNDFTRHGESGENTKQQTYLQERNKRLSRREVGERLPATPPKFQIQTTTDNNKGRVEQDDSSDSELSFPEKEFIPVRTESKELKGTGEF